MVCAGAVSDAFAIRNSISFLDMLALESGPFFLPLPAAWTPKVANVPVKTEAMKVGSSFCSGILNAAGNLTYAKVKIPADQTKTDKRTNVLRIASCSSLSSAASFSFPRRPFLGSYFLTASAIILI